jgi:type IV pilus assembly protein PilW
MPKLHSRARLRARGFSLVEFMIAMVLGLLIIAGVSSVFLANQQVYRANEALSDVQENSRVAFEFLARNLRVAGLAGCNSTSGRVANVLNSSSSNWFSDWASALHGYDDAASDPALSGLSGAGSPVAGTSSLHVLSAGNIAATIQIDKEPAANFKLNESSTDLQSGDIIVVCDYDHATIVQISNYNDSNVTVVHNTGSSVSPGNCSKGLGYPTVCTENGNIYSFPPNSQIAKLSAAVWYIGNNPVGGRSLYRLALVNSANIAGGGGGSGMTTQAQEMVRNVIDMQIRYLQPPATSFSTASAVTDWSVADSAQITLKLQSANQRVGVDAKPLTRQFTSINTVRNRVQ